MLSKYFGQALAEASIHLPDVEVRDLTFLADPKSCGWINKDDFIKVMVSASVEHATARKDETLRANSHSPHVKLTHANLPRLTIFARSSPSKNVAREQQSDAAKLRDLLSSQAEGSSSLSVEELTAILKESKDFEEADVKEWEQVLESFKQTKLYQKEEKVDAEDLVRALLHPESKGSDTPLDALSLNLAQ